MKVAQREISEKGMFVGTQKKKKGWLGEVVMCISPRGD
jgi:hypothetical protein